MKPIRPAIRLGACLSLTGRYARFGRQAAAGLETWRALHRDAQLVIEDDASDPALLAARLRAIVPRCDLLLGPYSTRLVRAASQALEGAALVWNHGGAGDDVQSARPGGMVSVLTPAGRYAEPFLRHLVRQSEPAPLWIAHRHGSFGRQVAAGAAALARELGIGVARVDPDAGLPAGGDHDTWDLLSAGTFEEDVATVARALALARPPRTICSVSAGVRDFATAVPGPDGILGIAQWAPGREGAVELGPSEPEFLAAYSSSTGGPPDYPAIQAAAAAVLACHCAEVAGERGPDALWSAAAGLRTSTLFGAFAIDPRSGLQVAHETVLVRWSGDRPVPVR